MTAMADHKPRMTVDEFEELAAAQPETVGLELIGGRIGQTKMADGDHGAIVMWLLRQCMRARPDLDLDTMQGLKIEKYRTGRARPDGSLAPVAHFAGQGEWAEPEGVLMTLEVTSYDADTGARDRVEKPSAYAEAGIPVYLLIDRDARMTTVHSVPDPVKGVYRHRDVVPFGDRVVLPEPVGFSFATDIFKDYVR
ncbi:Uma2 family endonuclease [Streptomyces fuscigenes]|uniref:Uma2 family endonuclease n=1 Tax=Streptomyces fuscigenes TaxID=1528880 RepID=UPI001F3C1414|nr:Uma2 family endonuclease [Streptomyces fuscigenes]MCF3962194.1 Uma2 family endonuclease [Streptomyces fuscigenes]